VFFGVREIIKSLKTTNKSVALVSAVTLLGIVEQVQEVRRKYMLKEITEVILLSVIARIRADFESKELRLIVDNLEGLDLTSHAGKLVFTMLAGLAEMEREMMLERQLIGINRAKAEGKYKGRKAVDQIVIDQAKELVAKGMTKKAVSNQLNIGESTLYKYLAM
jgi:DNA invertase Pin-like site-specific DNA recombinase